MNEREYDLWAQSSPETVASYVHAGDPSAIEFVEYAWDPEEVEAHGLGDLFEPADDEERQHTAQAFHERVKDLEQREGRRFSEDEIEGLAETVVDTGLPADSALGVHTAYEAMHRPYGGPPDLNDQDERRLALAEEIASATVDDYIDQGDIEGGAEFVEDYENRLKIHQGDH